MIFNTFLKSDHFYNLSLLVYSAGENLPRVGPAECKNNKLSVKCTYLHFCLDKYLIIQECRLQSVWDGQVGNQLLSLKPQMATMLSNCGIPYKGDVGH